MGERAPKRFDLSRFFADTDARLRRLERRSNPVDSSTGSGLTADDVRHITETQLVAGTNVDLVVDGVAGTITINGPTVTLVESPEGSGFYELVVS